MNRFATNRYANTAFATNASRNSTPDKITKPALWDTIIVGSSPLLMMEAIYLGRSGRKVLLLEKNEQLGGTWGRLDAVEGPYLDIGCHYFDISQRAYEFLRSGIGLNLVPFSPQPQFAYRNFRFPYDYRQLIRVTRDLKLALKNRSLRSFACNLLRDENYRLRMFPFTKAFLFPQGGARELITRLTSLAREADITILKSAHVGSIRFNTERKQVGINAGGDFFRSNEIVAGSQAHLADALHIEPLPRDTLRCVFTHVILVLRDSGVPTFSYIRFLNHDAMIRMTDVTEQMRYWNCGASGQRFICIGIRDSFASSMDDAEKVERLVAMLKQYRFIEASAVCENSYWSRYPAEFLSAETQQVLLRDFSPMIRLLSTTNFSTGIVNNLGRWQNAFAC